MKTIKKYLFPILFSLFIFHLVVRIFIFLPEYITPFNESYWEDRYNASQWVVPESKNAIGDDGLYAYAGWAYIHGADPTLLNAEIPPLAKYIIGVGEIIFDNQNILILIIGLLCLALLYKLNLKIFKSKLLAFIPVFLFSFDPLFYLQLRAPYLDTIYLLFLLLTLYFMLSRKYFLAIFFLGCFASTKFPAGSLFLAFSISVWVYAFDKEYFKKFLALLVIWPMVFLFSYTAYFLHGGSILGFLGVQKWIIHFYATGVKSAPGIVYPLVLFGAWNTWFQGFQRVVEWTVIWPITCITSVFSAVIIIKKYIKGERKTIDGVMLMLIWLVSYLAFLTFTPVFPRYLLLLLPFMYNLTVWFLKTFLSKVL